MWEFVNEKFSLTVEPAVPDAEPGAQEGAQRVGGQAVQDRGHASDEQGAPPSEHLVHAQPAHLLPLLQAGGTEISVRKNKKQSCKYLWIQLMI